MSYDITLETPTTTGPCTRCDGTGTMQTEGDELTWWNYTSNCAGMWRAAGADLAEFEGKAAAECTPALAAAVKAMETDPERFRAMNPPNKWGDADDLIEELRKLLRDFQEYPDAIVRVSR
jgi:hypothetical protein